MSWTTRFTRRARRDMDEKEEFLGRDGPRAVAGWRSRMLDEIVRIERDPHSYPLIEEALDLGVEFREALFGKRRHIYRIIFSIDDDIRVILVHHVRHAAQDRLKPDER